MERKHTKFRAGSGGQEGRLWGGDGVSLKACMGGFIEESVLRLSWLKGGHQGVRQLWEETSRQWECLEQRSCGDCLCGAPLEEQEAAVARAE